jgi:hypothetical protein
MHLFIDECGTFVCLDCETLGECGTFVCLDCETPGWNVHNYTDAQLSVDY